MYQEILSMLINIIMLQSELTLSITLCMSKYIVSSRYRQDNRKTIMISRTITVVDRHISSTITNIVSTSNSS